MVELAGIGKIALEEGSEAPTTVVKSIHKNPGVLAQEGKTTIQAIRETAQEITGANKKPVAQSFFKEANFAPGHLEEHFKKHAIKRAEWGERTSMTIEEYLNKAKSLFHSKPSGHIDGFTSKKGWIFKYNKITNEILTAKPDGTLETLFRPKIGINYWYEQIEKYK